MSVLVPIAAWGAPTGTVTVTVKSDHPTNTFVPARALGAGVDGMEKGEMAQVYTPANLRVMRSAGFRPLTYRLRTELGVEAWHWNPRGTWSDAAHHQGYWTSADDSPGPILQCYGYRLPRRGNTIDQANNDGYSRLDDGDPNTFWKSNPYLDQHYTREDNARHPQWILIKLDRRRPVNAVRLQWAAPFATRYAVQYWRGPDDTADPNSVAATFAPTGTWRTFPQGVVTSGRGGDVTLRLCRTPAPVRYVRILMTAASGRPPRGTTDVRDGLGYAVREIGLGTLDGRSRFDDVMRHRPDHTQTVIFTSSTDPWHRVTDRDPRIEQPGFDRVFRSGLTSGLPLLTPVGLLYDTPDNAAAELRFLRRRRFPVTQVEIGEEPDGQVAAPGDYAALYVQWADALHRVDPSLQLGGPGFQTDIGGWPAWADSHGDRSWVRQFLTALAARGRRADLGFFSFEWYPFDDVCASPTPQLLAAPELLRVSIARLRRDDLPAGVPLVLAEYGYSAFAGQAEVDLPGALLNADIVGQFLTLGGARAYLYGYEPNALMHEVPDCPTWGNLALLLSDDDHRIRCPLATYYAARLLTCVWATPAGSPLQVFPASCAAKDVHGRPWISAYALRRPDRSWSFLLLNKNPARTYSVRVCVQAGARMEALRGPLTLWQYGPAQYRWHPDGARGYPSPDRPPVTGSLAAGAPARLPPYSITVLTGAPSP